MSSSTPRTFRALFDSLVATIATWLTIDVESYINCVVELPEIAYADMMQAFAFGDGKDNGDGFRVRDAILAYYSNTELSQRGITDATEQCAIRERVADYFQAWCQEYDLVPSTAPSHMIVMMAGLLHCNAVEKFGQYAHARKYLELLGGQDSDNTLVQLLSLAVFHNVPPRVWVKSIDSVPADVYTKLEKELATVS